jgi:hypothetical protein
MNQCSHIQEIENDSYHNINKDIFKHYEDKIQCYQIENLATGDDYLNILINNIRYGRKFHG